MTPFLPPTNAESLRTRTGSGLRVGRGDRKASAPRLLAFIGATLLAAAAALAAAPFDLGQLMKTLAQVRSGEATFVERRQISMLDRTLQSSGRLSFQAPDTFVRETLRPSRDKIAVTGNTLTMSRGGQTRTMELDASPEAGVIIEAIRGTLTGNRTAIERHFEAAVTGTPERWTLDLVPREQRLRGQVASVKVRGEQAVVREINILLADGDRSVMTIEPVVAAKGAAAPR